MNTILFSQSAIFRIQQLSKHVYLATGTRYKISAPESLMELLRQSGTSHHPQVAQHYREFVKELSPEQISQLGTHGVNVITPQVAGQWH